jgi:hypothetical protein
MEGAVFTAGQAAPNRILSFTRCSYSKLMLPGTKQNTHLQSMGMLPEKHLALGVKLS